MPPSNSEHTEKNLLLSVAQGDEQAFRELVMRYSGVLFKFIYHHTEDRQLAEEIAQDIFLKIWLTRETLTDIRNFKSFLLVVSRNRVFNAIKKMVREKNNRWEWQEETKRLEGIPAITEPEAMFSLIDEAVEQLPSQQKKVWILSRREGLKYEQIAAEMNISKDAVKKYLQYANAFIKKYVTGRIDLSVLLAVLLQQ